MEDPLSDLNFVMAMVCIILSILLSCTGFAFQSDHPGKDHLTARIDGFYQLTPEARLDSVRAVSWDLITRPDEHTLTRLRQIYRKTQGLDLVSHITAWEALARFRETGYLLSLDSILHTADAHKLRRETAWLHFQRAEHHKRTGHYDLAMKDLLITREILKSISDLNLQVSVIQALGDFYFHAGLLSEAEEAYMEVLTIQADSVKWREWRQRVILSNLAQIQVERRHYDQALDLLHAARNTLFYSHPDHLDSLAMIYLDSQIAEVLYSQGRYAEAQTTVTQALDRSIDVQDKTIDGLAELYLLCARLHFDRSAYDEAIRCAESSLLALRDSPAKLPLRAELYTLLAKIHEERGSADLELYYLRRSQITTDSLAQSIKSRHYLQLLANNEYANYQATTRLAQEKLRTMKVILWITAVFTGIVGFYAWRLRAAFLALVRVQVDRGRRGNSGESSDPERASEYRSIHARVRTLMLEERLYLDSDINLDALSQELQTNRSYLSRAINIFEGKNFREYINSQRIEYCIHQIENDKFRNLTIEAIAEMCGFKNRAYFTEVFKKTIGVPPAFFISNYPDMKKAALQKLQTYSQDD